MIFGSVCSGIEAASAAWHPLGWRAAFVSEIEPFPCAVLAHHYPTVPNLGDMTKFQDWPDATIDVLVGGTPCQSFSVAGLRKGLADPRGNLMLTYLAIAARYRPEWLVWENVPGVLSSNGGRDFASLLRGMAELGYGFAYRILDAQHFGVPQRRRRVFVVGCAGSWQRAAAVLFERHSLQGYPAPRREARETAPTRTARSVAIRGRDGTPQAELGDEVANTILTPNGGRAGIGVGAILETDTVGALTDGAHNGKASACQSMNPNVISPKLDVGKSDGVNVFAASAVRRLTPRECERLQGFRDDYTLIPWRIWQEANRKGHNYEALLAAAGLRLREPAGEACPDGPRYKALGNSMAVPVMAWIGQRINHLPASNLGG